MSVINCSDKQPSNMEKYQIIGDEIVEGIPYSIPNNFPKGDPTVIGFEVNQLNFGPPQWELRLFPGGEWHGRRPHFSSRSQNRAQRSGAELWVIGPMLPLMVVDCSMSIRIVEVIGRRVKLSVPTAREMIEYLQQRIEAYTRSGNEKGIRWAESCIRTITGQGHAH